MNSVTLNGEKRSGPATGHEIVMAFDEFVDINFLEASYDEKVLALRRKCDGDLSTIFHPNTRALERKRHLMQEGLSLRRISDGNETTGLTRPVGEGFHVTKTARNQILRARKHREMKEGDALDIAPGIIRRSEDMGQVKKDEGPKELGEASEVPSRHQPSHKETRAGGEEAPEHGDGRRGTSGWKKRRRIKRKVGPSAVFASD